MFDATDNSMDDKPAAATIETTSRDQFLVKIQEGLHKVIQDKPELASNPAFSIATYIPGMEFIAACNEYLDAAQQEQFKAAMGRYLGLEAPTPSSSGEDIDVFHEVRSECQVLLSGRPDLQAQWDDVYGGRQRWEMVQGAIAKGKRKKDA